MSNEIEDPILSGMRAQRRLLDAAIAAYEAFKSGAAVPPADLSAEFGERSGGSTDVPNGAFNGMTVPAAVKLYLKIVNKKQSTAEIVDGLKKGDMASTARNFHKLVRASLIRLAKVKREIIQTGEHWALPEFFSPQVRASLAAAEPREDKKRSRSKKRANKPAKKVPPQVKEPASAQVQPEIAGVTGGSASRIEAFLREHPGKEYTIPEIAKAVQIERERAVTGSLGKLLRTKKIARTPSGKFKAAPSDAQPIAAAS